MKFCKKYCKALGIALTLCLLVVAAYTSGMAPKNFRGAVIVEQPPVFECCADDVIHNTPDDIRADIKIYDENLDTVDIIVTPVIPFVLENDTFLNGYRNFTINFGVPAPGIYNVEINAVDAVGNTNSCGFSVTQNFIPDFDAPTLTCPANIVRNNEDPLVINFQAIDEAGHLDIVNINTDLVYTTEVLSDMPEFQRDISVIFIDIPVGTHEISIEAIDTFGNQSNCSFIITQNEPDTQAPVITQQTLNASVTQGEFVDIYVNIYDLPDYGEFTVDFDSESQIGLNTIQYIISDNVYIFRYFAGTDFIGTDNFEIRVTDSFGNASSLVVDVNVLALCDGSEITGNININPGNGRHDFLLTTPNGYQFTRDHLHAAKNLPSSGIYYQGTAVFAHFMPKGNPKDRTFSVDGENLVLKNNTIYTLSSALMNVAIYNDHVKKGRAMGQWWMTIDGDCITLDSNTPGCSGGNCGNDDDKDLEHDKNNGNCSKGWDWKNWKWNSCGSERDND